MKRELTRKTMGNDTIDSSATVNPYQSPLAEPKIVPMDFDMKTAITGLVGLTVGEVVLAIHFLLLYR